MPRCSAAGCKQMGSHTFPKDPHLRSIWEKATNKEHFKASKHSRLCSGHFKDSDYVKVCVTTGLAPFHRYLKRTAIPSVFPWNNESRSGFEKDVDKISSSPIKKKVLKKIDPPLESVENKELENQPIDTKKLRDRSVRLRNRKAYLANRRCSVPQCNTRPSNETSLHQCPNNAAVRDEWAEALKVSRQCIRNMVACSLHFAKTDFIQSKSAGSKVLKQNAVPSRNLPKRKRVVEPIKDKPSKKLLKPSDRRKTMTDQVDGDPDVVQEEKVEECRACLKKLDYTKSICNVFQAWSPPWKGMEATIAEDLAKLANVEVSITDRHSKVICSPCYQSLLDAAKFAVNVRGSDLRLRQRFTDEIDIEKVWPKPIQVDKNINRSVFTNTLDVEIKQEVVSDEEQTDAFNVSGTENAYAETELSNVDIKIEPEEMVESPPMNITINGTISLNPLNSEIKTLTNGTDLYHDDRFLETTVKQEPMSEEEEVEQVLDMPLECLLCTKSFNSVTGLKAHVIAHHSYKSVKRKADGSVSPEKKRSDRYQCAICRRSFQTSTDLMVHETCHNKHSCYGCTKKFDSFELLTRHRKQCKSITNSTPKLKTLGDVKRTRPEVRPETLVVEIENRIELPIEADSEMIEATSESIEGKQDESLMIEIKEEVDSSMKLHLEIHSAETGKDTALSDGGLQVETLKNDDCL